MAWRDARGELVVGSGVCPHLGAPLALGRVDCGTLRCRWHGLALDGDGGPGWRPLPAHDDGVLAWVRLDDLGGHVNAYPSRPVVEYIYKCGGGAVAHGPIRLARNGGYLMHI